MSVFVTVNVKPKTKQRLKDRALEKDESYDEIVSRLLDETEGKNGKKTTTPMMTVEARNR